nr:hypothetical protein [Mycobacterium colombiense]
MTSGVAHKLARCGCISLFHATAELHPLKASKNLSLCPAIRVLFVIDSQFLRARIKEIRDPAEAERGPERRSERQAAAAERPALAAERTVAVARHHLPVALGGTCGG